MSFPETRLSFIQRLASVGDERDWQTFLSDYWGPVFRFAMSKGARASHEAEDVAAETFEVLWKNRLLVRWAAQRTAKLRTLLCTVVRHILANRFRSRASRRALYRRFAELLDAGTQPTDADADAFYAAWADDLINQAVESLVAEYYRNDQGDYVRVLYGRLCEGLTIAETGRLLSITPSNVDYYFRHARHRLAEKLLERLRAHVERYSDQEHFESDLDAEWAQLGSHLAGCGGLEQAVRRTFETMDPCHAEQIRSRGLCQAAGRLTAAIRAGAGNTRETSH